MTSAQDFMNGGLTMDSAENIDTNAVNAAPNPFPVEWDDPEEAQALWGFDVIHCPAPLSRLDFDLRMQPLSTGVNRVNDAFGLPLKIQPKLIHGFVFQRVIFPDIRQEAVPELVNNADAAARRIASGLARSWQETWLPEIQAHLSDLTSFDPGSADWATLVTRLSDLKVRMERLWELHNIILLPALVALSDIEDAYRDLFPDAGPLDVYDLLGGFPSKTTEANTRLWELGRAAARTPHLRALLTDRSAAVVPALQETPEGRALWSEIQDYLRVYGERNDDLYIDTPTWIEDPKAVLEGLRKAVSEPDRDLGEELRRQVERRETRLGEVRARISSHPRAVQEEFEALLSAAQAATVLTEDHHFWLDCKITYHARRLSIEVGKRLVERGVIERPGDVFQLTLAEITGLGADPAGEAPRVRAKVAERLAEAARFAGVTPPPILGVLTPFLNLDCAIVRATGKFNGNLYAPPGAEGDLTGMAGSRGKVTGPARVARTIEDAAALRPGEILVVPFTLPSWTPFFASAAAVVTNIGGILCHAAVVAREYGIPAVVGTVRATMVIRDGQIIEVDGDAGIVRFIGS
jgi:phosphohistidine swiveling domain-containing protein